MENLDEIIKEIRENGYNQELIENYWTDKRFMRELVDGEKICLTIQFLYKVY